MTEDFTLTASEVRDFHLNGFISITTPIATAEEIETMRDAYDRMFAAQAGREEGNQFDLGGTDEEGAVAALPQILDPGRYAPELRTGPYLENAQKIMKQLLGDEARVGVGHAIFKPAGYGAPTPWHQDEAYWDPGLQYYSVSIWMPLQEATIENGCMWFLPGSHEWPILPHQSIGGDTRIHGLELLDLSVIQDPVACPLPAGGITIHRNRTLHYAGPNVSDVPRRALILGSGRKARPYLGERSFPWNEAKNTPREERAARARSAAGSGS